MNNTDYLNEAIRAYERGYYLRNDYYTGINFAFLLNARASESESTSPAEAIADYVRAQRVRKEVIALCTAWLEAYPAASPTAQNGQPAAEQKKSAANRYWVLATQAEAYFGLGQQAQANQALQEASSIAPESWMQASTLEQLDKLEKLLASNPLRFIQPSSDAR